jgi:hypothetical protein
LEEALELRQLLTINFAPPSLDVQLGPAISAVRAGDFQGNGLPGIITAVAADAGSNLAGSSYLLTNTGGGTFGPPVAVSLPPNPQHIAVADFNNDGKPDLASTNGPYQAIVDVALNRGDGTFDPPVAYAVSAGTGSAIAAADVDGDGKIDLVVGTGNNNLSILRNQGGGAFAPATSVPAEDPTTIASADFNHDGLTDLTFGQYFQHSVAVDLNLGGGAFPGVPTTYPTPDLVNSVAVGDFNGDGLPDIVAAAGSTLNVFLNLGNGTFGPALSRPMTSGVSDIAVGDFDHDGKLDVALAMQTGPVQVLPGLGNGRFGDTLSFDLSAAGESSITAADFTGSGSLDLAYNVHGELRMMRNASTPAPAGALGFSSATYLAVQGAGTATITVTRAGGSTGVVSVHYATSAGSASSGVQYQDVSGTLTFADGQTTNSFNVPILNGSGGTAVSPATVNLALTQTTGGAVIGPQGSAVLQIDTSPTPVLSISDVAVSADAGEADFIVTSTATVAQPVTVQVMTADGSAKAGVDYTAVSTILIYAPGELIQHVAVPTNPTPRRRRASVSPSFCRARRTQES